MFCFSDFTVRYRVYDDYGQETYLSLLSDWDLEAAILRYCDNTFIRSILYLVYEGGIADYVFLQFPLVWQTCLGQIKRC